jgi:hypothetical protein
MIKKIPMLTLILFFSNASAQLPHHVHEENILEHARAKKKIEKENAGQFADLAKQHIDLALAEPDTETQQLFGSIFVALEGVMQQSERIFKSVAAGNNQGSAATPETQTATAAYSSIACAPAQKIDAHAEKIAAIIARAKESLNDTGHYEDRDKELQQLSGALFVQLEALRQQQKNILALLAEQNKKKQSASAAN